MSYWAKAKEAGEGVMAWGSTGEEGNPQFPWRWKINVCAISNNGTKRTLIKGTLLDSSLSHNYFILNFSVSHCTYESSLLEQILCFFFRQLGGRSKVLPESQFLKNNQLKMINTQRGIFWSGKLCSLSAKSFLRPKNYSFLRV